MPQEPNHESEALRATGDYEYDMAHDPEVLSPPAASSAAPVHVPTESDDDGQDLEYDLAHDIPRDPGR